MILNYESLHHYINSHKEVNRLIVLALVLQKCLDHLSLQQKQKETNKQKVYSHQKIKIKRVTINPYAFKDLTLDIFSNFNL